MSTIDSNPDGSNPPDPEPEEIQLLKAILEKLQIIEEILEQK